MLNIRSHKKLEAVLLNLFDKKVSNSNTDSIKNAGHDIVPLSCLDVAAATQL
jgi:hypothetical protein